MSALPVLTAVLLVSALIVVVLRALDYLKEHPELVTDGTPLAYQRCVITLRQVIERYKQIEPETAVPLSVRWTTPGGTRYVSTDRGIEEHHEDQRVYALDWDEVGGIGIRMQPGFSTRGTTRLEKVDNMVASGYSVYMLIVPISGPTISVLVPTDDRSDAVDYVAYTIALAERAGKRINVFGFDRAPQSPQHGRRYR